MFFDFIYSMQYNDIARAAYNKLSEEEMRKRKEEYLKEKEEYEKEMERLGKPILRKARVQIKVNTRHDSSNI